MKRILVGCEESGRVTKAFRDRGFEAFSVDLQETSGPLPQFHFKDDLFDVFYREGPWDCVIAFPPCTYLSLVNPQNMHGDRVADGEKALDFVRAIYNLPVAHLAIENPSGYIGSRIRPCNQMIQPYMFGDPWSKRTCLWLRGLPPLISDVSLSPGVYPSWIYSSFANGKSKERSKTFPGVAKAMAEQWGDYLLGCGHYPYEYTFFEDYEKAC